MAKRERERLSVYRTEHPIFRRTRPKEGDFLRGANLEHCKKIGRKVGLAYEGAGVGMENGSGASYVTGTSLLVKIAEVCHLT